MDLKKDLDIFKAKLKINKHELDEELIAQPDLLNEVGWRAALAVSHYDNRRQEFKEITGRLFERIKTDKSLSDKRAEYLLEGRTKYKTAHEAVLRAKYLMDLWAALKESFIQRSFVLKDLAALYIASYYTTQSVSGPNEKHLIDRKRIHEKRKKIKND